MARTKPITIENWVGGWSTNEEIGDNQLAEAKNWFYNSEDLLQTRAGSLAFGSQLPDSAIFIHNMDTFGGNGTWALDSVAANDATNIATDITNNVRGAGAVSFDIDVSLSAANFATVTNSTFSQIDLSSAGNTGDIRCFLKFTGAVDNITGVRLRWGSDVSNYFEKTITTQIDGAAFINGTNLLSFDWETATEVGTVVDTAIDYLQVHITYGAAQVDMTTLVLDSIVWYSGTFTKSQLGNESFKTSSGDIHLVYHVGTSLFAYNETQENWDLLITGLAETRGQFAIYKDILYYVNGTDYISFDGKIATEEATPARARYLFVKNDVAYAATANSSTLLYSNGNPASLKVAFSNSDPIEEDNGQIITGLGNIGNFVYVAKSKSIYKYDVSGPAYVEIDGAVGVSGFRSLVQVDNNLLFQGHDGNIYNSFVEETANARTKAKSLTDDLKDYTKGLESLNLTAAIEYKKLNHVYFSVDNGSAGLPVEVLVLNVKLSDLENNFGVFTRYTGISANDFTIWEDTNGVEHLLVANAYGGQALEIETGQDDDGTRISVDLQTKAFEIGTPTIPKFMNDVDGIFQATDGATFQVDAIGDDPSTIIAGSSVSVTQESSQSGTLSVNTISTQTLGGITQETLRRFKRRLPVYNNSDKIQIRITDLLESHVLVLEKLVFNAFQLGKNVFTKSSIL